MPPRSAVTAEQARLYGEAASLSEGFCARLTAGEDVDGDVFIRRRQEILGRIQSLADAAAGEVDGAPEHDRYVRESTAAIECMRELDRQIVKMLETRMSAIGQELAQISRGRRSLASYRGPAPVTPAFLDRRG